MGDLKTPTPPEEEQEAAAAADDDDDPVVESYAVFAKAPLLAHRKLLVLQYPNTFSPDPSVLHAPPLTEVRAKPATGMVEVDVPLDTSTQYDRAKGVAWGAALRKITAAKDGGSLGLPGGFGVGAPPARTGAGAGGGGRRGAAAAAAAAVAAGGAGENDDMGGAMPWNEALRQDMVLRTRTLGGRAAEETDARYVVAVYQGKNVHLTPVSSLVQLRPHLHHLDAAAEQDRLARSSASAAAAAAAAAAAGGGSGGGGPGGKEGGTARAIHMTLKAAMDDDGVAQETMVDRLRAVQTEPWRRMEYVHHESEAAWATYSENLLQVPRPQVDGKNAAAKKIKVEGGGVGEEKSAAAATVDDAASAGAADLVERLAHLAADPREDELLRAVSGIKANEKKPGEEGNAVPGRGGADAASLLKTEDESASRSRSTAGRPVKNTGGGATAARRGGRAGRGANGSAMEID